MRKENKVDEMVDILSSSHQYVPTKEASFTVEIPEVGATEMKVENMHVILLGGDQLTAERARAAGRIRQNSQHPVGRLEGILPVTEDWHTKVCFMEVWRSDFIPIHRTSSFAFLCTFPIYFMCLYILLHR